MNDYIENRHSMALAVLSHLDEKPTAWNWLPIARTINAQFRAELAEFDALAQAQNRTSAPLSQAKESAQAQAATLALEAAALIEAFAQISGDSALASQAHFTRTDLIYERDTICLRNMETILELLKNQRARMGTNYDATPARQTALQTAIANYRELVEAPRNAIADRSAATEALADQIRTITTTLQTLDNLVQGAIASRDPLWSTAYFNARQIIDNRSGTPNPENPENPNGETENNDNQ